MLMAIHEARSAQRQAAGGIFSTSLLGNLFLVFLLAVFVASDTCHIAIGDEGPKKSNVADMAMRPYRNGPLTAADFRCPPPNPLPQKNGVYLSAMTYTSLHYNTHYRWHDSPSGKFEARLTGFEIVAEVDRRQSWTTRPTDERLLDHEQGHFDVTEMWARRIQNKFNGLVARGVIVGHGDDQTSAIADMDQQVDSNLQTMLDDEHKAQDQYDIATRHGTNYKAQADERQKQAVALHGKTAAAPFKEDSP
jgi:hypothetical protein